MYLKKIYFVFLVVLLAFFINSVSAANFNMSNGTVSSAGLNSTLTINFSVNFDALNISSKAITFFNLSYSTCGQNSSTFSAYNFTTSNTYTSLYSALPYNLTCASNSAVNTTSTGPTYPYPAPPSALLPQTTSSNSPIVVSSSQLNEGYQCNLQPGSSAQFVVMNEIHTMTVENLSESSATISLQSNYYLVTLNVGEEKKLNLTNSSYYDFDIKLNSIANGSANITISAIHELISNTSSGIWNTVKSSLKFSAYWLFVLIPIAVVIFIIIRRNLIKKEGAVYMNLLSRNQRKFGNKYKKF